jgi:hypothetical protein
MDCEDRDCCSYDRLLVMFKSVLSKTVLSSCRTNSVYIYKPTLERTEVICVSLM